jgi:predicted DNA-binding transcriptional regulator AlpA
MTGYGLMRNASPALFDSLTYTREQLAAELGVSVKTLARWHTQRIGPARCKIGQFICYRREAVNEWLIANENRPEKRRTR